MTQNSTSGNLSEETQDINSKEHKHPMFVAVLFTIAKIWKQPRCPSVDEWIKQLQDIYTREYYSAVKKNKILPFVTVWIDLENIMLSEVSQSEKDKYHRISLICGRQNLMSKINFKNRNRLIDTEKRLEAVRGERG